LAAKSVLAQMRPSYHPPKLRTAQPISHHKILQVAEKLIEPILLMCTLYIESLAIPVLLAELTRRGGTVALWQFNPDKNQAPPLGRLSMRAACVVLAPHPTPLVPDLDLLAAR
jgi:hypothetical protein